MKLILILFSCNLFLGFNCTLYAQDTIFLKNPSFEDTPRKGGEFNPPIKEWHDCGSINFPGQSPPDIHSGKSNFWDVTKSPENGDTYISFVTRYSDTYESVSQLLDQPFEAGKCYQISAYVALSETYNSATQRSPMVPVKKGESGIPGYPNGKTLATENFSNPIELLIWAGDKYCSRKQLLVHSGPIDNYDWKQITLELRPKEDYQYITIGGFYVYGYTAPYNGHILVDNLSPIVEVECK